jgi:hypothetical protein
LTRLLLYSAVAIILALALSPIFATIVLFKQREFLLGLLPLLYAFPYYLGVAVVIRPLIKLLGVARTNGIEAAKSRVTSWQEQIQRKAPTDEQYAEAKGALWRVASRVLMCLYGIFILPTLFLKIALGTRLGGLVAWWPDFDSVSFILFATLSYLVAGAHHPAVALAISCYLFLLKLFDVISRFETHHGVLRVLSYPKHQVGLSAIIFAALIMVASCGCIHYCISLLRPSAYSQSLTAIDGLYFSVTTFATVGYGDIYPRTALSKLACIGEIVSGCLVLVFGVNLAMAVWFQKFTDAKADPAGRSSAAKQKDAEPVSSSECNK